VKRREREGLLTIDSACELIVRSLNIVVLGYPTIAISQRPSFRHFSLPPL
jgi:hypothetical protein